MRRNTDKERTQHSCSIPNIKVGIVSRKGEDVAGKKCKNMVISGAQNLQLGSKCQDLKFDYWVLNNSNQHRKRTSGISTNLCSKAFGDSSKNIRRPPRHSRRAAFRIFSISHSRILTHEPDHACSCSRMLNFINALREV